MNDRHKIPDETISEALRELPRIETSPDFTRRLVARAENAESERTGTTHGWRLAAAAALVVALFGGYYLQQHNKAQRAIEERQALVERQEELRRDLEEIRARVATAPTLYVGTARNVDVVLDLEPWIGQPAVRPASYTPNRQ